LDERRGSYEFWKEKRRERIFTGKEGEGRQMMQST
jgi:hypothetical protein